MSKTNFGYTFVLGLVLTALASGAVNADAEGIIKYRQGVMKAQAGHMGAMAMIVRGKADFGTNLVEHARGLQALTRIVPTAFPVGSDAGETDALPLIWKKSEDFKEKALAAEKAVEKLVGAVQTGDKAAIGEAFKAVGKSCKGCHQDYRKEQK